MDRYLKSLVARHRALDRQIAIETARRLPSPTLARLKRMKLAVKDRIAVLAGQRTPALPA